ncbi:MAG: hypothetical protein INQ03_04725 [Candidatus Heimdallarchaeota archaeon]|nr:hypothetical protein [Candidatus Heimdallarchaeota archaeon]
MKEEYKDIISDRIVGTSKEILPEFSATLGAVLGTWLKNKATIAIARDFRTDSRMMKRAFTSGLMSSGISAIDFHAVPTPLLQFYIRRFGADAGVMFTSSHYEGDKKGIRIFNETGSELTANQLAEVKNILLSNEIRRVDPSEMTDISDATGGVDVYVAAIKNVIDWKIIAEKHLKVVIDCALGPVSNVLPAMLSDMNVEVIAINSFSPKSIPKTLPNSESLVSLAKTVKANEADIGIAFDVEGSRVVICDENGTLRSTDKIAGLLISRVIQSSKGKIIISDSLSRSIEDIVASFGKEEHEVIRVADEPGVIAKTIRDNLGIYGVSDEGSFWQPSFTVDSDGIFTALKLLELLAKEDTELSTLLDNLPQLPNNHREIVVSNNKENNLFTYLENCNFNQKLGFSKCIDTLSGLKVVFKNGWVQVTPSSKDQTIIRLTAEANPFQDSNKYLDDVVSKIKKFKV